MDAAGLNSGQKAAVAAGTQYTAPLLTTSSASRANTATNTATLNTAVNGIANGNANTAAVQPATTLGGTPAATATPDGSAPAAPAAPATPAAPGAAAAGTDTSSDTGDDSDDISNAVSVLPPSLQKLYGDNLSNLQAEQTQAKSVLTQAQATLADDPAATAAVNAISAKYDVLINQMNQKNAQVLGSVHSSIGAFGGLGSMSTSFLSDEMDRASQRIADLTTDKQNAILNAQAAYQKQDLAAFNTAMDKYNKTITDMNSELSKLNDAADKQIKNNQAQQKIDAAASKAAIANDVTKAANLGGAIAKQMADSGLTDPDDQEKYIASVAQAYGISDPAILQTSVVKAQQTAKAATDMSANVNSEIAKRNAGPAASTKGSGTDANYSYTADDVTAAKNILQNGGAGYAAAGSDGYSDPGAYVSLLNSWIKQGGTAAGFAKVFPIKTYVNPKSYNLLPQIIQQKAAATPSVLPK